MEGDDEVDDLTLKQDKQLDIDQLYDERKEVLRKLADLNKQSYEENDEEDELEKFMK